MTVKSEELRIKNEKAKAKGRKLPKLAMPNGVDDFMLYCYQELEQAVKKHPYFADTFAVAGATLETAQHVLNAHVKHLDSWISHGFEISASDIFEKVMAKATVAWFEGDREAFTRRMAQSVAVQIRAWQLGLKTMKKGGAK